MKYSEANRRLKQIDSLCSFVQYSSGLALYYDGELSVIMENQSNEIEFFWPANHDYRAIKLLIELHETPVEEREDEKKYYIKVISDDGGLYLNYVKEEKEFTFSTRNNTSTHQTQFTKQEVNSWLKATTLAIDWDKALEEVPRDEVSND